jgi:hypothetical protein
MSRGNKQNTVVKVITYIIVLLLLAGAVGAIVKFTGIVDKIREATDTSFHIVIDDTSYTGSDNNIKLQSEGQSKFEIKNGGECSVKVLPNVTKDNDFSYTADGVEHSYLETDGLTSVFFSNDCIYGDYFILKYDKDFTLESILSQLYNGVEIVLSENNLSAPYVLVVTSESGESISFNLCLNIPVTDIVLPSEIIF